MKYLLNSKTKLLSSLFLISFFSLSIISCQGEKGDKGEQGIQGESGPKGDKGDPGEDGIDGIDGATWLTGNTKPDNSLGKEGDMYLNTSNGDVYQKISSGWVLKMNIKGEDGEDGKDGTNGSNGSDATSYFPTTIIPSKYGYVIPDKASAKAAEKITYKIVETNETFQARPLGLRVFDKDGTSDIVFTDENSYRYVTLEMKEGGLIIQPMFSFNYDEKETTIEELINNEETWYKEDHDYVPFSKDHSNSTYIVEGYIKEFGIYDDFNSPNNAAKKYGNIYLADEKGNQIHLYSASFDQNSLYAWLSETEEKIGPIFVSSQDFSDENNNPKLNIGDYVKVELVNLREEEGGVMYQGRILEYKDEDIKLESATLENLHDLKINEPFKVKAKVSPYNASYDNITYEIIDNDKILDIYKMDNYYVINPTKAGLITVNINIDGATFSENITIKNEIEPGHRLDEVYNNYKDYLNEFIWLDGLYRGNYGAKENQGAFIGEKDKMFHVYKTDKYVDENNNELPIDTKVSSLGRVALYRGQIELKDPLAYKVIDDDSVNIQNVEVLDYSSKTSLQEIYDFDASYGFREFIIKGYIADLTYDDRYGTVYFVIELNKGDSNNSDGAATVSVSTDSRYYEPEFTEEILKRGEGSPIKLKGNIQHISIYHEGVYLFEKEEYKYFNNEAFELINCEILE